MKTIINKIPIILLLFSLQFCKSQNKERYVNAYNNAVPQLRQVASSKHKFYMKNFSEFIAIIENKGVVVDNYSYRERGLSPKIYDIILNFTNLDDHIVAEKNNFLSPYIMITLQEQVPDQIRQLTLKNNGKLTQEVKDLLADRKIVKIEFYGINGLASKDRSAK